MQARTNLRHLLHQLRHAVPELAPFVEVTPSTLRWRSDSSLSLDVEELERLVDDGRWFADAAGTYTGDLLAGSTTTGCFPSETASPRCTATSSCGSRGWPT